RVADQHDGRHQHHRPEVLPAGVPAVRDGVADGEPGDGAGRLRHYRGRPVAYLNSCHDQSTPNTTAIDQTGMSIRLLRQATSKKIASTTATTLPGFKNTARPRSACTAAVTPRVMPQNGHGTPVSVRSGHGGTNSNGTRGRTAATPSIPAPKRRSASTLTGVVVVHDSGSRTATMSLSVATTGSGRAAARARAARNASTGMPRLARRLS